MTPAYAEAPYGHSWNAVVRQAKRLSDRDGDQIVIVDDDPAILGALSAAFGEAGLQANCFDGGDTFLAAVGALRPRCTILDVVMPGRSGLEILKALDPDSYGTAPVFILSGRSDAATVLEAMKNGAFDFLEKRRPAKAIVARVVAALDRAEAERDVDVEGSKIVSLVDFGPLSEQERDVFAELMSAASISEAALRLGISTERVEVYHGRIMIKLAAKNVAGVIRRALTKDSNWP